ALPLLEEPPLHAEYCDLRGVIEEIRHRTIETDLSDAVRILAADGPVGSDIVCNIQRRDVALLKELGGSTLQSQLISSRHVIEVRVFRDGTEAVVPHWTVRVPEHALGVTAAIEIAERVITERVV